jgi:hypothetical protein
MKQPSLALLVYSVLHCQQTNAVLILPTSQFAGHYVVFFSFEIADVWLLADSERKNQSAVENINIH